jgi:hypothetical protein
VGAGGIPGLMGQGHSVGYNIRTSLISRRHVEDYLLARAAPSTPRGPIGDKTRRAIVIALKACWNWAADDLEDGGGGYFEEEHRPQAKLGRGLVSPKDFTEADLPTDAEIEILNRWGNGGPF